MTNLIVREDPPSSGSVAIYIEADTAEAVAGAIERYLHTWHPMGYGTAFVVPTFVDGRWRSIGHRRTSCD